MLLVEAQEAVNDRWHKYEQMAAQEALEPALRLTIGSIRRPIE